MSLLVASLFPIFALIAWGLLLGLIVYSARTGEKLRRPSVVQLAQKILESVDQDPNVLPRIQGKIDGQAVFVRQFQGGKGAPTQLIFKKNPQNPVSFKFRPSGFDLFTLNSLGETRVQTGPEFQNGVRLYSEYAGALKFTPQQIEAINKLSRLPTFERINNEPTEEGFEVSVRGYLLREERDVNETIAILQETLRAF